MPLVKSTLAAAILAALQATAAETDPANLSSALTTQADAIADAIDTYVKSGLVTTVVTGTLPAGPVAAVGTGALT